MQSTLPPKQTDDPHDFVAVPSDAVGVAPADSELVDMVRDLARRPSQPQTRTEPDFPASDRPAGASVPPVDTTFRPTAVNNVAASQRRRSIGRSAARGFAALLLAICLGVATSVWKSHGDAAQAMIAAWTPQLTSWLPLEKIGLATPSTSPSVEADTAPPQAAAVAQTSPEGIAANAAASADSPPSLESMARDLASASQEIAQLKASIAELKANQQQMAREVAKTSGDKAASDQNARAKLVALPPRPAVARPRKPIPPFVPAQAAAAPALPQAAAPSVPRQVEPLPPADPELSSVPRPPLPVR
jgi:hypothetical protein